MTKTPNTATIDMLLPGSEYPDGNIQARFHYTDAEIDELAASLMPDQEGQLRPLLVATHPKKPGKFFVFAGGRRRIAYGRLIGDGKLPKDHPIEIKDHGHISVHQALAMSAADNLAVPMHPADQAQTFAQLAGDKSPEDIARERGMTVRAVNQSISLGRGLSPLTLAEWRAGHITREAVEVLALAEFGQQDELLTEYKEGWQFENGRAFDVKDARRKITRNKEPEMQRLLGFVGLDAARAEGVEVTEDFFGEGGVVKDMKPLKKLARAKMETIESDLKESGWAWVETRMAETFMHHGYATVKINPDFTKAEQARLQEIAVAVQKLNDAESRDYLEEHRLSEARKHIENTATFRAYTDAQKAKSGVIVSVTSAGTVKYEAGLIRKEEPAKAKKTGAEPEQRKSEPPKEPDTSEDVRMKVEEWKDDALAELIAAMPKESFALFLAAVSADMQWNDPISIGDISRRADEISTAHDFAKAYEQFRKLPIDKMAGKLAILLGAVVDISGYMDRNKDAALIVEVVGEKNLQAELSKRFDPKFYVSGASNQHLLGILAETEGEDFRSTHEADKEAALRKVAIEAITIRKWLPPSMRTRAYAGPSAKKPGNITKLKPKAKKSAKSAAPKKKKKA